MSGNGPETGRQTDGEARRALGDAVDWTVAARVGARLGPRGPAMSRYTADQVHDELAVAAVRAQDPVREVTGLAGGLVLSDAEVTDRPGWVRIAARSMGALAGATDTPPGGGTGIGAKVAGVQAGGMLAFLSGAILGQYDPFGRAGGVLALVAPNVVGVERALAVPPADFRLWVCVHEVTHQVQFAASQWLADYMQESVALLGDVGAEPVTDLAGRVLTAVRGGTGADGDGADGESPGGVVGVLRATLPHSQRIALDRLLVLGTLLEGHADHVMDAVGPAVVPSVSQIRAAFDARRQQPRGLVQRLIRALLGMDAKMQQYVRGKAFVDAVVTQVGMAEFNTVWSGPETLPLPAEIEAPQQWISRVLD
ncbi:zinc-dependent metalloprotease [Skermania piniformis]|uniref:Zinc-dependent metalloprotease n=2 Tax=Skermania pinensis TaxID=39122 RepID=A0ABX8SB36_9ACTN|nr:zinc-dependent metalloprotease [Skermania piniformis]QXQ13650.1 zinc-dependent metalloprotease [Skermania piniformis]